MIDPTQAMEMLATETARVAASIPTAFADWEHDDPIDLIRSDSYVKKPGRIALWVVFIVMLVASAGFTVMAWSLPLSKRLFHTVTTFITVTAAISYFAMATGHAVSWSQGAPEYRHLRQVLWARYVDWAITTPLLLVDLGLLAGMSGGHLLMAIGADVAMVLTGLFAAFPTRSNQKWGWYAISCVSFLTVIWHLGFNGRRMVQSKSSKVRKLYGSLALFTITVWVAYPVIWAISEGARLLSVDGEVIAYAVLDILAKPVFGFWLLYAHGATDDNVEIGGFWANGITREGAVRLEDDDGA